MMSSHRNLLPSLLLIIVAWPLSAADILFVGGDAFDPIAGDDSFAFEHLESRGHVVTYMEGAQAQPGDEEDFDLLVISSTLGSGTVRGKFQDSAIPILNWEEALMRSTTANGDFSMSSGSNNGGNFQGTQLEIINPAHPLAAGLSGIVEYADVSIAPAHITGPAPGVISIAKLPEGATGTPTYVEGNAAPVGNNKSIRMPGAGTIDVPTIERPGGEFAYAFWFNPDSQAYGNTFDTNDPRVDFFYGDGNGGSVRPHLSANRNGRPIGIYVNDGADVGEPIEASIDSFATDEWHHIVINWDGDLGTVFVNGKLDNEVDLGGVELVASGTGVHIGTTQTSGNPFRGLLDEVAIWDRNLSFEVNGSDELTGGEIATIFNNGIHALDDAQPGPIGYWPFDDQSDPTVVVDESGNRETGFLPDAATGGKIAISAVETGGELNDGTLATGRRVNFPIVDSGFASLTDDGLALFDAAINWLLGVVAVPGDFNNDGLLTVEDVNLLNENIAAENHDPAFELTGDELVNRDDLAVWVRDLKGTWFGDANLDGEFNSTDLVDIFQAGHFETAEKADWSTGDWNADGIFNSGDFVQAFQDGGYEQGSRNLSVVPEPSAIALLLCGVAFICSRRRSWRSA